MGISKPIDDVIFDFKHIIRGGIRYGGKHQKNADHNGYIVITEDAQSERNIIQACFFLLHESFQSDHDQRKQRNAVHPHNIPTICRHKAAQCICRRTCQRRENGSLMQPVVFSNQMEMEYLENY